MLNRQHEGQLVDSFATFSIANAANLIQLDIAKLIVDSYVEESFRMGYDLNIPDDTDNSQKDQLDVWTIFA